MVNKPEDLFVEILLEGGKLVLLQHATLPPRFEEAKAVAHQLDEGSRNAEQADPQAFVLQR